MLIPCVPEADLEKKRRTYEGSQTKKKLVAEANSEYYSPDRTVERMFNAAEPTSSRSKYSLLMSHILMLSNRLLDEDSNDLLEDLITRVAHLTGIDYSEACRKGEMGVEELMLTLEDPYANDSENEDQSGSGKGKGISGDKQPQYQAHYPGVSNLFDCFPPQKLRPSQDNLRRNL
jgi:hypothetical protein